MRGFLQKIVPALLKVLRSEFGDRAILRSTTFLLAGLCILFFTWTQLLHPISRSIAVATSGFEFILLWRFGALEILGQILCAGGAMQANLSDTLRARRSFLRAMFFLTDRSRAYAGLYQMAETKQAMRDLAKMMQAKERHLSSQTALLLGRCLFEGEEVKAAAAYFELADKLAPSDSAKLELGECYLANGAAAECLQTVQSLLKPDVNGRAFFLRASALRILGRPMEAAPWANRAVQARPCNPDYRIEKGRILEDLGRDRSACHQYSQAVLAHPRNPEALFRRACLRLRSGDKAQAIHDLDQCYYYDNTRSEAYLLAHSLKTGEPTISSTWSEHEKPTLLTVRRSEFELVKGQSMSIQLAVEADRSLRGCRLQVLEPFGWGLEVTTRCIVLGEISPGERKTVSFEVKAKRASEVNLNEPWVLNVILTAQDCWTSRLLRFKVTDPQPGRVFLVLTNDHEPQIHRERVDPGGKCAVLPDEVAADLVKKAELARELAEKYGLKWTLMLDAGTAIGLPKWAGSQSTSWKPVYEKAAKFYLDSLKKGHDCQVHLHLKAVPESFFFCYHYDSAKDIVSFDRQKQEKHFGSSRVNSWANMTRRYGRPTDMNSRVGSIVHAARVVTNVLASQHPFHQPVLFRAGQWDLGASVAEREKSIMALRRCGVLADSSVAQGYNCYERPFRFGSPPARATYFTFRNNPEERARSLVDAGIMQAVPILLRQGGHPMTPRDDPRPVIHAYRGFLRGDRVAPGPHLIMEIEHFGDIRDESDASGSGGNGCWRSMERHFAAVRNKCPALEGVGGAEAIYAWLEYYSPEPVVRLGAPNFRVDTETGGFQRVQFPMRFIGDGILTDDEKEHILALSVPSFGDQPQTVRVLQEGRIVLEVRCSTPKVLSLRLNLSEHNQHDFILEIQRDSNTICNA